MERAVSRENVSSLNQFNEPGGAITAAAPRPIAGASAPRAALLRPSRGVKMMKKMKMKMKNHQRRNVAAGERSEKEIAVFYWVVRGVKSDGRLFGESGMSRSRWV